MRRFAFCLLLLSTLMAAGSRIEVHGHRGARAVLPENTLPAFEYAIAQGVDVLELDMAVTKDNVIVVSHDPILAAPICTAPRNGKGDGAHIRDLTLAEVRQYDCGAVQNPRFPTQQTKPGTTMPTLDEVFALASKGTFRFNIETKITPMEPTLAPPPDEFVSLVLAVIRKHHLESRVILQSFDFRTLHAMKKIAPEIAVSALVDSSNNHSFVDIAKEADARIISPEFSLVTAEKVEAAHAAGLQVVPWTANTPTDWDRLIAANVDAIITDDPAGLIAHLKKQNK